MLFCKFCQQNVDWNCVNMWKTRINLKKKKEFQSFKMEKNWIQGNAEGLLFSAAVIITVNIHSTHIHQICSLVRRACCFMVHCTQRLHTWESEFFLSRAFIFTSGAHDGAPQHPPQLHPFDWSLLHTSFYRLFLPTRVQPSAPQNLWLGWRRL